MPAKARNLEIAFRMGSYTKVRLLEDVGRGKKKSHQNRCLMAGKGELWYQEGPIERW